MEDISNPVLNQVEAPAYEPGPLERLRNSRLGQWTTKIAIGASILGGAAAYEATPVAADSPVLAGPQSPTATESGALNKIKDPVTRECVSKGLHSSKVLLALLDKPGTFSQGFILKEHFDGIVDEEGSLDTCKERVFRKVFIRPEVQNADNHSQWLNKERPRWRLAFAGNRGVMTAQIIFNHQVKASTYRPTPGPGVTHARLKERVVMTAADNHNHVLAQKREIHPVRIRGGAK